MKKNKVKKIVGVSLVFGIIFLIVAFLFHMNKEENVPSEYEENLNYYTKLFDMEYVVDYPSFFSVVNDLNKYLSSLDEQDVLYNLLSKEYLTEKNITLNNVLDRVKKYENNDNLNIRVKSMSYKVINDNYVYFAIGDIYQNNFDTLDLIEENVKFLVAVDYETLAYSIYPIEDFQLTELPFKTISILNNNDNQMQGSKVITEDYICNLYYSLFYNQITKDVAETYDLTSKDFSGRRFNSKDEYVNYMKDKVDKISPNIYDCSLASGGEKRIYVIKDYNYNIYTFTEKSIMNYEVDITFAE